jgi:phage terminase large subunit GpA-like protein
MAATWEDLDRILFETVYPCADGRIFHVWRVCLDTGGTKAAEAFVSRTEEAYQWIATRRGRNGTAIFPCKGSSGSMATKLHIGKAIERTPSGKPIPGGMQIIQVNTQAMKDVIWWRIERAATHAPGALYLHASTPEWYAKQVTAEEKRVDRKTGRGEWVPTRRDNHMLDCEVLCEVAADAELMGGVRLIRRPAPPKPKPEQPKPKAQPAENPWTRGTIGGGR